MKALIVGGGVAGLATAVAFQRAGIDFELFERAPEIRDIGAGKSVWHNGVQALEWLGMADTVRAASSPIEELLVLSWSGRLFHRIPIGRLGPSLAVERQQVLTPLVDAVESEAIRTSARCVKVDQDDQGVTAHFDDGTEARGDVLVGADGIFSTVRGTLFPGWDPRYAGHVAWRGIAEFVHERWPAGISFNWYGRGKHIALMPLKGGRMFWYATKNLPYNASDGGKEEILESFSDTVEGIPELIAATEPGWIVRNRLYDLPFRRRWCSGRVVLLGDAAHAMRPNLGQGACVAIEDAIVLAQTLRGSDNVVERLRSFEHRRRRRARWIHRWSEITSRLQLLEGGAACRLRDSYLWLQPGPILARTFFRPILNFKAAGRPA